LERLREELAKTQTEIRQDQQYARMVQERDQTVLQLRAKQLKHYRQLLEQREASLSREISILEQHRHSQQEQLSEQFGRLELQQKEWKERVEVEQADIKRQQNMLSLHAENLETRRHRLEQLQKDVEATHRETLEMKVVVEEKLRQLSEDGKNEASEETIQAARQELSLDYRQLREELRIEREKLTEQRANFAMQLQLFEEERAEFRKWVEERDQTLSKRQKQLEDIEDKHDEREQAWRQLRSRWLNERIEAEELIRKLLGQLTDAQDPSLSLKTALPPREQTGEAA